MSRPRVLAVAYACHPERGSEEGVGWGWVRAASQSADLTVLTTPWHAAAIERWRARHPEAPRIEVLTVPHRRAHYRPTPRWIAIENSPLKPIMNLAYQAWLGDAYRLARAHVRQGKADLVHLMTYVGYRFPGRFHELNVPFVWGPVGGLENTAWRLLPMMGSVGALYYAGRNTINWAQRRALAGPRRAARAAAHVFAATQGMQEGIRRYLGVESEVLCEIGTPEDVEAEVTPRAAGTPLRIVWSGEHLPGKALPLLLEALTPWAGARPFKLTVLGTGPSTIGWQRMAQERGLTSHVTWTGWIPRREALANFGAAHVLAITSLKDLTSTVLLEGLASGLPAVALDHCGFRGVITPDCGRLIPLGARESIVAGFRAALEELEGDDALRTRLAQGALARSRDFTWARKAERLREVYARIVGRRT